MSRPNVAPEGNIGLTMVFPHAWSEQIRHRRWIQNMTRSCPVSRSVRLLSQVEVEKGSIPLFRVVRTGQYHIKRGLTYDNRGMTLDGIKVEAPSFLFQDRQQWP